jgi:hypothetical protein
MQSANVSHPMPRCGGSHPIQKTFSWISVQGLGRPATPSQIDHFQGVNAHPNCHCVN